MDEGFRWAAYNPDLEGRYPGEYLVVWRKQAVAHGTDLEAFLQQATTPECPRAELVVVEFPSFFESHR